MDVSGSSSFWLGDRRAMIALPQAAVATATRDTPVCRAGQSLDSVNRIGVRRLIFPLIRVGRRTFHQLKKLAIQCLTFLFRITKETTALLSNRLN